MAKKRQGQAKRLGRLYGNGGAGSSRKHTKPSPFEYKSATPRFDVLGKTKRKSGGGARGTATTRVNIVAKRDEGVKRREKSLLVEYNRRHTANTFVDRRFGEDDETLNEEDRAILRFQRERVRQAKRNRYALGDGEDDEYGGRAGGGLTHGGRDLDDFDDSELRGELDSDGDGGAAGDDGFGFVQKGSYKTDKEFESMMTEFQFGNDGGGDGEGGSDDEEGQGKPRKTKKEVMQELIAKSKYYKGLRAKEKDEDETLRNQLDDTFKEIMRDEETVAKMARLRRQRKLEGGVGHGRQDRKTELEAGYDKITEDLVFEFRQSGAQAQPTREEMARRAKQRLEEMEKERLQIVEGKEELEDEDPDKVGGFRGRRLRARAAEEEGVTGGTFKEKLRRKNASLEQTGDDLGDDFDLSDDEDAGGDSEQSGSSYYSEDSDGEGTEESSGADEGGELSEGLEEEEEAEEEGAAEADEREKKRRRRDLNVTGEEAFLRRAGIQPGEGKQRGGEEAEELATTAQLDSSVPFVIETPTTYADFSELMTGRDPAQQAEILRRIRISNPVSLGQQNRKRAQAFYGILLQFFSNRCRETPLPREALDLIVPEVHTLTAEVPLYAATVARARLDQMHRRLLRGEWPTKQMLGTLELFAELFDPLQPRHPVLTPMTLLISKWLLFTPVRSGLDLAKGLYLVKIAKKYACQSGTVVPESLRFLTSVLGGVRADSSDGGVLCVQPRAKKRAKKRPAKGDVSVTKMVMECDAADAVQAEAFDSAEFKLASIELAFELAEGLLGAHRKLPSAPELFQPLGSAMAAAAEGVSTSSWAQEAGSLSPAAQRMEAAILDLTLSRRSLGATFKEQAKQVKQYNPRFEEDYVAGKDYDVDRDRSDRKRLRRDLKREKRGAMRELRKDNKFLATVKNRERDQTKEDLQKKYNKQFHFLEQQQSDMRSGGQKGMIKLRRK